MAIDAFNWRSPIIEYLKSRTTGTDLQSTKFKIRATKYTFIDEVLYKKSFTLPYLMFLDPDEAEYTLRKIHEGICGQQMGG